MSNALLPCPEDEIQYICQGKGIFLMWPSDFIFPILETDNQVTEDEQVPKELEPVAKELGQLPKELEQVNVQVPKKLNQPEPRSPSSQTSTSRKYTISGSDRLQLTTPLIHVFKDLAISMKKIGKTITFEIPKRVFENEQSLAVDYEDMLDWCFQKKIGASHMSIFMMYLSDIVNTEGISRLYGFCDLNCLSSVTPTTNEEDRSDYLSRVLGCNNGKNKNQLFFAPYNEGLHWTLAVICPWIGLVFLLDPAGVENEPCEFSKKIINEGIIMFRMEHRKDIAKIKKNPHIR